MLKEIKLWNQTVEHENKAWQRPVTFHLVSLFPIEDDGKFRCFPWFRTEQTLYAAMCGLWTCPRIMNDSQNISKKFLIKAETLNVLFENTLFSNISKTRSI